MTRGLKNRHVQLISIGGVIGTGLFLGSGKSISLAGPSILLTYVLVGVVVFLVTRALGELLLSNLNYHSYVEFIEQYLGKRHAFVTGWTYWFCWIALGMTDLTATGMYMRYWAPDLPQWIPIVITLLVLTAINLGAVKHFGELEFWFALIKVVAVIALIVVGVVILVSSLWTGDGGASVSNIWAHEGGFFPHGFSGFMLSFQMVTFAFVGVEVIGIMAGEADNPRKNIPKAINNVPIRVGIFYVGSIFILLSLHPWTAYTANSSPFVDVFSQIGVVVAATIINCVVITAAASACNSAIYSTSRMLYSLGKGKNASKSTTKLSKSGVPHNAVIISAVIILASAALNYFIPNDAFNILTSLSTICFLFVWVMIILTHFKYRKSVHAPAPIREGGKEFRLPFFPYTSYIILASIAVICVVMLFIFDTLLGLLCLPIWVGALYLICWYRTRKR